MRSRWIAALLIVLAMGCKKQVPYAGPWVIEDEAGAQIEAADDVDAAASVASAVPDGVPTNPTDSAPVQAAAAVPVEAPDAAARREPSPEEPAPEPITDARVDVDFGECFGDCPVYSLHFRSDGTLTGPGAARKLGEKETQGLLRLFDDAFAKPIARCPRPTDVQQVHVTYRRGKTVRSTEYWTGQPCPSKLVDAVRRLNARRGR